MAQLTDLTVREMQEVAREIKMDPMAAVHGDTEHRWTVIALTEWIVARRADPHLKRDDYLDLTVEQLIDLTGGDPEDVDDDAPEANPTEPEPSPS